MKEGLQRQSATPWRLVCVKNKPSRCCQVNRPWWKDQAPLEPSRITCWCHAQPARSGTFPDIEMSTGCIRVLNPKLLAAKRLTIANFSGSGGLHFSGFAQQVFVLQVRDDHASSTFSTLLRRRRLSSCDASAIHYWHGPLFHWHHPTAIAGSGTSGTANYWDYKSIQWDHVAQQPELVIHVFYVSAHSGSQRPWLHAPDLHSVPRHSKWRWSSLIHQRGERPVY